MNRTRTGQDDYWCQFEATVSFLERCEVAGTIIGRGKLDTRDGAAPQLRIRLDNGYVVIVNAVQTRLLAELVRLRPAIGDRITIVYRGPAPKAAPGMNPTKEFDVTIHPHATTPPAETAADPTVDRGATVDAPGPDRKPPGEEDSAAPPLSTATVPGPGPDEPPNNTLNGERVDVTAVKARIAALTPLEREAFRAWLAKTKIPDSVNVSEAKVRAVNAELDRRATTGEPAATKAG